MLPQKTVFVIGAGAGVTLSMPVGKELGEKIVSRLSIEIAGDQQTHGDKTIAKWLQEIATKKGDDVREYYASARKFASAVAYNLSIDEYISTHAADDRLKICGKLAIAQLILEYESECPLFIDPETKEWKDKRIVGESWLMKFFAVLREDVALEKVETIFQNLTIINFNYDRCIEQFLAKAINDVYHIGENAAGKILDSLEIYHPYGSVGSLSSTHGKRVVPFGGPCDDYPALANEIKTYAEQVEEETELKEMRSALSAARRVVFMGNHYHAQNMKLLTVGPIPAKSLLSIYTVKERSAPDQNMIQHRITKTQQGPSWTTISLNGTCEVLMDTYAGSLASPD